MGLCKFCREDRPFIRAHIIPAAFHRDLQGGSDRPPIILGTSPQWFPKRNPGGLYDETMLCGSCEARFGPWDQYGAQCLLQNFETDQRPISPTDTSLGYQMVTWDERRLRMFAISLLWRAAVTTNEIFRRAKLGPHEGRVRERIVQADPGDPADLAVFFCKWTASPGREPLTLTQISPYTYKLDGVNVTRFFLGGFVIYIKVDRRKLGSPLDGITLSPGRPVYAIARDLESSKEWTALRPGISRFIEDQRR